MICDTDTASPEPGPGGRAGAGPGRTPRAGPWRGPPWRAGWKRSCGPGPAGRYPCPVAAAPVGAAHPRPGAAGVGPGGPQAGARRPWPDRPGDQVWLDLEDTGPAAPDPEALDRWLAPGGPAPEPPLVVLLRDDAAARVRTHRLAVDRPGRVLLVREGASGGACALGRPALLRQLAAAGGWRPSGVRLPPPPALGRPPAGAGRGRRPHRSGPGLPGGGGRGHGGPGPGTGLGRRGLPPAQARRRASTTISAWPRQPWRWRSGAGCRRAPLPGRGASGPWNPAAGPRCGGTTPAPGAWNGHWCAREHLAGFPGNLAVFTGRPPQELSSAFDLLGFRLPAVGDSAPHLRKPRPEGLIQLADAFRAGQITFVGDSRDDASALGGPGPAPGDPLDVRGGGPRPGPHRRPRGPARARAGGSAGERWP